MMLEQSRSAEPEGSVPEDAARAGPRESRPACRSCLLEGSCPAERRLKCSVAEPGLLVLPPQPCGHSSPRPGLRELRDLPHPRLAEVMPPCGRPAAGLRPHVQASCSARPGEGQDPAVHTQRCPGRDERSRCGQTEACPAPRSVAPGRAPTQAARQLVWNPGPSPHKQTLSAPCAGTQDS